MNFRIVKDAKKVSESKVKIELGDFFKLDESAPYDLIYDYTQVFAALRLANGSCSIRLTTDSLSHFPPLVEAHGPRKWVL
jgi:hypothetical protein